MSLRKVPTDNSTAALTAVTAPPTPPAPAFVRPMVGEFHRQSVNAEGSNVFAHKTHLPLGACLERDDYFDAMAQVFRLYDRVAITAGIGGQVEVADLIVTKLRNGREGHVEVAVLASKAVA